MPVLRPLFLLQDASGGPGASLLLVNHALFFSDLVVRQSGEPDAKLLPDYEFVIFDEAHHLETAAAAAFGIAFASSVCLC